MSKVKVYVGPPPLMGVHEKCTTCDHSRFWHSAGIGVCWKTNCNCRKFVIEEQGETQHEKDPVAVKDERDWTAEEILRRD